jgi:hypothetical protein
MTVIIIFTKIKQLKIKINEDGHYLAQKATQKQKTIYLSFPHYKTISYIRGSQSITGFLIRMYNDKYSKNKHHKWS